MQLQSPAGTDRPSRRRAVEVAVLLICPVLFEVVALGSAWRQGILGFDMKQGLLLPAEAIREGISPFAVTHYPPLVPVLLVPFTFLPSPAVVVALLAAVCVPLTLWALDVRDWRCYGAAFLWPPVFSGIQTANVTLFLVFASALAWRYRERAGLCAAASGLAIGAKLINLPLVAWLAATGRLRAAAGSLVVAVASTLGLGLILEITLRSDHGTLNRFQGVLSAPTPSYSVLDISSSLGAPNSIGLVALGGITLTLVAACVVCGRRGDDVASFSAACLACLVAAPNVWLHSFAFLLPVVALTRPQFSAAWLAPLVLVVVPVDDPPPAAIAFAWLVTAALALHLFRARDGSSASGSPTEGRQLRGAVRRTTTVSSSR